MSRVLVTGGAGFIGSHVVDALLAAGHEPVILDLGTSRWHDPRAVRTVLGDCCDVKALDTALEGCDAVAHLAAAADVDLVAKDPLAAERANARGTASVLDAARRNGVPRVLYASTIWVYSDVCAGHADEQSPLPPPAHLYSATKLAGELYCRSYAELYGVEYTVLRFGIPYGPRARPAAVVPLMVARALAGEPLSIAGDGAQTRCFVYVEDLAAGVVAALAPVAANRTYNLVGDRDVSIAEVARTVCAVAAPVEIVHTPGRNGDFGGLEVDGTRAARELGWTATTPFAEGVRRYVEWVSGPDPAPRAGAWRAALVARARAVLRPVALFGLVVAALGALGSMLDSFADEVPRALLAMALALPMATAALVDWDPASRRRVGAGLFTVAACCLVLLALPLPGASEAREHIVVTILLAASSLAGAAAVTGHLRLPLAEGPG